MVVQRWSCPKDGPKMVSRPGKTSLAAQGRETREQFCCTTCQPPLPYALKSLISIRRTFKKRHLDLYFRGRNHYHYIVNTNTSKWLLAHLCQKTTFSQKLNFLWKIPQKVEFWIVAPKISGNRYPWQFYEYFWHKNSNLYLFSNSGFMSFDSQIWLYIFWTKNVMFWQSAPRCINWRLQSDIYRRTFHILLQKFYHKGNWRYLDVV